MDTTGLRNRLRIGLQLLSNAALGALAYETMGIANKMANETVNENPIYRKIPSIYDAYSALIGKKYVAGMGKIVREADKKRDTAVRAFVTLIRTWAKFPATDLPAVQAAKGLLPVVNLLKGLSKKTYAQETQYLQTFVQEMSQTDNQHKLKELGIFGLWEQLLVIVNDFVEKHENEMIAAATKRGAGYATYERKKLEEVLVEFYSFINLYKKDEPWELLFVELLNLQKRTKW